MQHLHCHQKVSSSRASTSFRGGKTETSLYRRSDFSQGRRRGLLCCVAESDRAKASKTKSGTFSSSFSSSSSSSSSSTKSSSSSVQNVLSATLPVVVMSAVGVVGIEECLMPTEPAFAGSGGDIGNVALVPTPDVGYGKPNFKNVPKKGAPRPKIEVKRRVKPSYAGSNAIEGIKIDPVSLTDEQSLAAAVVVVGGGVLVAQSRAKKPQGEKPSKKPSKYKNVRIDTSRTSGGKVEFPERKFEKAKWGGDDAAKTPTMKKELVDEKTTTASVDAAADAQKWIDDWEKNKDQVGSTTEEQEAAQKWIDQWKADGSPTDESRVEEAKKWIEEWKRNKDA